LEVFVWVLQSVLILLGIGIVGFWVARRNVIPENVQGFLVQLAVNIALPCLVFSSIVTNFSPEKFPGWWQLPLWWFVFAAISLALTLVTMFVSRKETRSEFAINLFYQNGLFFPLIIIGGVFGQDASYLPELYIFIIIHPVMFFSTYPYFFKKTTEQIQQETPWHRIVNPILVATILAIAVQLIGVKDYLPDFVHSILETLGRMALPLIMIILGGSLYLDFKQKGKIYYKEIIKFLIIKNIVFPLALIGILVLWQPSYSIALLFLLQAAVPPVTATPILTERAGGNKAISNQFVLSSVVFSIISVPSIFHLFSQFFPIP
jgi:predicted permease